VKKLNIEEFAMLERLKVVRVWSFSIGVVSVPLTLILVPTGFHHAARSPHETAFPAFSAIADAGYLAWLILPMIIIGVVSLGLGIFTWWKIRRLFGE